MAQIRALAAHHQLILHPLGSLPLVMADSVRIAQVISNLISNSVKHSPQNTFIRVSARHIDGFVKVSVSDEGSGIPIQDREKVFQAFEQLETPPRSSGVGLGLAICKALIEAHGGQIWVEEQEEPGTTVSFTLPVAATLVE
jgi:two-component system sensor histidine kinase KdpD